MSYAMLEKLLVIAIVLAAVLLAGWRLAGPVGRQRIVRRLARLLRAAGAVGLAAQMEIAWQRNAATAQGSPCSSCGPAADSHKRA